jgi:aminoglycoside 6'-N-acetyltransferase
MLLDLQLYSGFLALTHNHLHGRFDRGWTIPPIRTIWPQRRTPTQVLLPRILEDIKVDTATGIELIPTLWSRRRSHHFSVASSNDSTSNPPIGTSESKFNDVPQITLRNATIDDIAMLLEWDEKEHLQGSYGGDPDFNDWNWVYELRRNDLSWRYQLIAQGVENESHTIPIGFVQIIDPLEEESHYWGIDCEPNLRAIDIWIGDERYINRGCGTKIMKQVLQSSFVFGNMNVIGAIIDPMADNYAAHRFYQRLGFVPIGIQYFGPDRCLVHRMNRIDYYNANPDRKLDCNTSKPAF